MTRVLLLLLLRLYTESALSVTVFTHHLWPSVHNMHCSSLAALLSLDSLTKNLH